MVDIKHLSQYARVPILHDLIITVHNRNPNVKVKDTLTFPAHRLIVSYHSKLFMERLVSLEQKDYFEGYWHIELDLEKSFELFPKVLNFLYGEPIEINEDNAYKVLFLAKRLGIHLLERQSIPYILSMIKRSNVIKFLRQFDDLDSIEIQNRCLNIIAQSFESLYSEQSEDWMLLSLDTLKSLVNQPNLILDSDISVVQLIHSYLDYHTKHLPSKDKKSFFDPKDLEILFQSVRFPYMSYIELEEIIKIGWVPEHFLSQALVYKLSEIECQNLYTETNCPENFKPRNRCIKFDYIHDLDYNGCLYYLSTNGGKGEWKNPSLTGSIKVSASSIEKGKVHHIVELQPNECWTMGIPSSWFALDLRQGKLLLTHYTLRHGGSTKMDALRNWILQGSDDGISWKDIRRHQNDTSLNHEFAVYTWETPSVTTAFRQFRILQSGHNSGNNNFLCLSGIELYGHFYPFGKADKKNYISSPR